MPIAAYRGIQIPYRIHGRPRGARPTVAFVSGAFQTMDSWTPFAERLAERTQVLLADLPGTSGTAPLPRSEGFDFLARALLEVCERAGAPRVCLFGASYGGPIAYRAAQLQPWRISQLMLGGVCEAFPDRLRRRMATALSHMRAGRMADFAQTVVSGMLGDATKEIPRHRLIKRMLQRQLFTMDETSRTCFEENTERVLTCRLDRLGAPPRVPTVVFVGEQDEFTTPTACRRLADRIPGADFSCIPGGDHLVHLEQFEDLLARIERYVDAFDDQRQTG